ncbi:tetracycline 6-hydroxylase protein [Hortaea werneckii]|nr:tetracycline 6-hydroxylase protein [Hortaea werneckii]KAI7104543.1 tetracycline 6-hydroxylase protein [Hortaea werneckii]KAI7244588.1 tetracycline 6-hydroxylase protein [Hortaea werneckii]KAI7305146.1 tetracycline 6-hydroxylase protein [Hortaea werneckii]KAI7394801.1 tetracycline 6-hydroxylase protein [Hortaea werneckii]
MALHSGLQFHLNGFKGSGDPLKLQYEGDREPDFQTSLPTEVDVLIVGAGPAGQLLGTQLAQFPEITTRIVETKPGRLQQGQADGLQCRTIEIFEAFGFSERVLKEAYWVNETTFWSPTEDGKGLRRTGRIRDTEEGLSEFPHVILNQARLHDLWLDAMKWSPTRLEPSYSRALKELRIPPGDGPVDVTIERLDEEHKGQTEHVKAKYVVGCDGARSMVRRSLGLEMKGDFANQAWGVMDALVVTDFPDLRLKTAIHSANEGSILIIPREGGYLARFYIELDKLQQSERIASKNVTADVLVDRAQRIFKPFNFEVRHIAYWSVYEVGQRLTDHFDDVPKAERNERTPRVFIAGDACHTHSAKAGQGMNVSMNDAYNLGWKLASVLKGQAHPELLHTYTEERQNIAQQLIDFDREIARLFAAKPKSQESETGNDAEGAIDPAVFQDYFTRQGRFMAGVETQYAAGPLTTGDPENHQALAPGYRIGMRFPSDQVLRLADAKPVHLGHILNADGRWRILLFGPETQDPTSPSSTLWGTCAYLHTVLIPRYTRLAASEGEGDGEDIDSLLDIRAILPHSRHDIPITALPPLLLPHKGRFGIQDYEKVFTDEASYGFGFGDVFRVRGVSRSEGAMVLVRPDQYVSAVLPLGDRNGVRGLLDGVLRVRGKE